VNVYLREKERKKERKKEKEKRKKKKRQKEIIRRKLKRRKQLGMLRTGVFVAESGEDLYPSSTVDM